MMPKKRGRPMASHDVRVTPEFRDNPDIEKLGRALIAAAISLAKQKKAAEAAQVSASSKADGVT